MADPLKAEFPSQGWKQILTSRKEILDAYDRAREQARAHEVETFHGKVAEAAIRKWLSGFLPKRYGVTSGYIVSPGIASNVKAPHFDVIVYDQLESPVLWVEENPDASAQGRSLAIPVEYVHGVLEIKASFSAGNVTAAIAHLGDLLPVMNGVDDPGERYKLYLPPTFFCGVMFCELRTDAMHSKAALAGLVQGMQLRGFVGGLILRAEGHTTPQTARIALMKSEAAIQNTLGRSPLSEFAMGDSVQVADNVHIGAVVRWRESEFSQFAFDMIALMKGTYQPGRLSSFYGVGNSFREMMKDAGATIIDLPHPNED